MEPLTLVRHDILLTSSLHRNCAAVAHSAKRKQDKLVIGDDVGVVQCVTIKQRQAQPVFKNPALRRSVTALANHGDRLYVALGPTIAGYTKKKGAQFLTYSTPLSEDILHMRATDTTIFTACEFSLSSFTLPTKENPVMSEGVFWQAHDRIGGITSIGVRGLNGGATECAVVGTADRAIRLIHESEPISEVRVAGPIDSLKAHHDSGKIMYGTENGVVGIVALDGSSLVPTLELRSDQFRQAVTSLSSGDMARSGAQDLLIGYDDGSLLVYSENQSNNQSGSFEDGLIYSSELHESIVSLDSGRIHNSLNIDMVVATYSGKILTVGHDPAHVSVFAKLDKGDKDKNEKNKVAVNLQNDIDDLFARVQSYKEKLNKLTFNTETGAPTNELRTQDDAALSIKSSMRLIESEGCHLLTLEIPQPLELVILQSTLPLEFIDHEQNKAIRSLSMPDVGRSPTNSPAPGTAGAPVEIISVYRLAEISHRLEAKFRVTEGDTGMISAYVIPKSINNNTAIAKPSNRVMHTIKPLSLHARAEQRAETDDSYAATLTISGAFSAADAQTWLRESLPSMPPPTSASDVEQTFTFSHCSFGLRLMIKYRRGFIEVRSVNPSALAAIKQHTSEAAIQRKCKIDIAFAPHPQQVTAYLTKLRPLLEREFGLGFKHSLIAALEELELHEGADQVREYLEPYLIEILDDKVAIRASIADSPATIARYTRILHRAFIDQFALQGRDGRRLLSKLDSALSDEFNFEALLQVFKGQ